MIAKIKTEKISNSVITRSIKELEEFWGFKIKKDPIIFILDSRKDIDRIRNQKTDKKLVAWFWKDRHIFILDKSKFIKESAWPISSFDIILKHELSHFFFYQIAKNSSPAWLDEGLACYLSDQECAETLEEKEIKKIIDCYYDFDRSLFESSTLLVKLLINLKGKEEFVRFIKSISFNTCQDDFKILFENFYKTKLNSKKLTKLLK